MIHIHSIGLKNVVSFKKAKLKIEKAPLTFVYGQNLDADDEEGITGNGTGKSLLFSSIPNLRYSAPPTSRAKKAKKDLLYKKGSAINLNLTSGSEYSLTQRSSGFDILMDGVDQQIARIPDAEKEIANIFPLSDIEFYTTVFLATNRKHSMQAATDTERLEYFTSIFKFDFFDDLQAYFAKKSRAIKDDQIRMQVLEQSLFSLDSKIKQTRKELKNVDLDALAESKDKLEAKTKAINDKLFNLANIHTSSQTLVSITGKIAKLKDRYTSDTTPSKRYVQLKALRKLTRQWDEYDTLHAEWSKQAAALKQEIKSLSKAFPDGLDKSTESKLLRSIEDFESKVDDLKAKVKLETGKYEQDQELSKKIKKLTSKVDLSVKGSIEDVQSALAHCKVTLKLKRLLDHDHSDSDSTCPTCLSKVDLKSIRRAVKTAEKEIPALEHKLEALEVKQQVKELKAQQQQLGFDMSVGEALYTSLEKTKAKLSAARSQVDTFKELKRAHSRKKELVEPRKPEEPRPSISIEDIDSEMELCSDLQSLAESLEDLTSRVDFSDYESAPFSKKKARSIEERVRSEIEALNNSRRKLETELAEVSNVLNEAGAKKAELDLYKRERQEAQEESDKLRPNLERKKVVDSLLKFYSSKAERARAADAVCTLLESNLNLYRELIFVEPFTFQVEASATGISIRVDRGNGHETDVRYLSAAEADCFSCLFLMSILPLIHESRRVNMVVLDEPMCHAHEVTRKVFRDKFLPVLCSVVPHVFVITQNDDDYIEGSRKLYIVKEEGVSRIEDAHTTN